MVMANNGRGDCYEITKIQPGPDGAPKYYVLNNGAVHVKKLALSGWHLITKIDRYYRKVN
jgi:hypothetical protein